MIGRYYSPLGQMFNPRHATRPGIIALLVVLLLSLTLGALAGANDALRNKAIQASNLKLPLSFEPNTGQTDPSVSFIAHSSGGVLSFASSEVALTLVSPQENEKVTQDAAGGKQKPADAGSWALPNSGNPQALGQSQSQPVSNPKPNQTVRLQFMAASADARVRQGEALPGKVNYLLGNDPAKWRTNIPTYSGIYYDGLYAGINLKYDGTDGLLKGTYTVAAGADPTLIRWRYDGAKALAVDGSGNLIISLAREGANLTEHTPIAWQEIEGKRVMVSASYTLAADNTVSFKLVDYDKAYPLTIDPTLTYSTYIGTEGSDTGVNIAADSAGNVYIVGSEVFTVGHSPADVYVRKIGGGGGIAYTTYLGGVNGPEEGRGIALDPLGNVYVTGLTWSDDFPVSNAYQGTYNPGPDPQYPYSDAFAVKLNASGGGIIWATYLGGENVDEGHDITADAAGNAYITLRGGSLQAWPGERLQGWHLQAGG